MTRRPSDPSRPAETTTPQQCMVTKYISMAVMMAISGSMICTFSTHLPWSGQNLRFLDRYLYFHSLNLDNLETISTRMSYDVASRQETLHVWRLRRRQVLQRHRHPRFGHHDMDQASSVRNAAHGKKCTHNDSPGVETLSVRRAFGK